MANQLVNSFAITSISSMYLNAEYADVHFKFPNDEQTVNVPAHKNILATVSKVFSRMFYGPLKEGDTVTIDDSNASAFKEFLQIIYLPEVTFTMENFEEVIRLADKYDMVESLGACIQCLEGQVTSENAIAVYQLSILLDNQRLKEFCNTLIKISTKDVLSSDSFLQCEKNVIEHILQMDKLECKEIDLFDACMKWAASSCQRNGLDETNATNLKNQLGNCFRLIRFGAIEEKCIGEILANETYKNLFTHDELADFFRMKMDGNFRSEIFDKTRRTAPIKTELSGVRAHLTAMCCLKSQESVWFSTNKLVQLKCIYFGSIKSSYGSHVSNSSVEIIEYSTNPFHANASSRTLATKYNVCGIGYGGSLPISPPITINPLMTYEIRAVNLPVNTFYYSLPDTNTLANEIILNDKIRVKFHYDPSDHECARRNLVSKWTFLTF